MPSTSFSRSTCNLNIMCLPARCKFLRANHLRTKFCKTTMQYSQSMRCIFANTLPRWPLATLSICMALILQVSCSAALRSQASTSRSRRRFASTTLEAPACPERIPLPLPRGPNRRQRGLLAPWPTPWLAWRKRLVTIPETFGSVTKDGQVRPVNLNRLHPTAPDCPP